ncbi:MAG: amylo-alpha-1,6-glucosidase, partial [Armatimonadota bacterium]
HLIGFRLYPFPTFIYDVDGFGLVKRIFMVRGRNLTIVTYRLASPQGRVTLRLRPLVAGRGYHTLNHRSDDFKEEVHSVADGIGLWPYGPDTAVYVTCPGGSFEGAPEWYYSFQYPREMDRGLDHEEDLFSPGYFTATLEAGESISVLAGHEEATNVDVERAAAEERGRREQLIAPFATAGSATQQLALAADQFLVRRNGERLRSIIAGYHWFTDWGRDTMIALPGLTLALGRPEEAKRILQAFAAHCSAGMIPNRFPDGDGPPEYNTVDASLWFVRAAAEYVKRTGDLGYLRAELFDVLWEILDRYANGTRFDIHMEGDGLITAGGPGLQLTWMDAKVGDVSVTPRHGKCVEINALWFNALKDMQHLAKLVGRERMGGDYADLAAAVRSSFGTLFWNQEQRCLYDRIEGTYADPSIRPNQILAVSLPHELLPPERQHAVVQTVHRELYTPYGLRSLARSGAAYVGTYGGNQRSRDGAYHQGTVWAWLMGPFITAWLKVNRRTPQAKIDARQMLTHLLDHMN